MVTHTVLRSSTVFRRALGTAVLALALPLTACGTGNEPSEPTGSAPAESGNTADPADDAGSAPDPTGKWSSPEAGEPFLDFSENGDLTGSDGCNVIKSTWEVDGDKVLISSFVAGQKACPGDQWLATAASATIEGNVMKIMDGQGEVIGGLEKET